EPDTNNSGYTQSLATFNNGTSDSFSYTAPSGGSNKVFMLLLIGRGAPTNYSASLNGKSLTVVHKQDGNAAAEYYGYPVNPASGTFSVSSDGSGAMDYFVFTVKDADQTNPIDASGATAKTGTFDFTVATTTTNSINDLVLVLTVSGASPASLPAHGGGQ